MRPGNASEDRGSRLVEMSRTWRCGVGGLEGTKSTRSQRPDARSRLACGIDAVSVSHAQCTCGGELFDD
eukprot:2861896-Pleurochrysis_carterae.AAC.1